MLNHPHFPNKYDGFVASIDLEHCALLSVMKLVNEKKKAVPGMRLNCIAVKIIIAGLQKSKDENPPIFHRIVVFRHRAVIVLAVLN